MKTGDIFQMLDREFPLYLQEKYDNAGGQVIFPEEEARGILFCLDVTPAVIDEAVEKKCNVIISHHPYFFKGLKRVDSSRAKSGMLIKLVDERISCYSAHTNYDKFMNRFIEKKLGLEHEMILYPAEGKGESDELGFGTLSRCPEETSLEEFMKEVKDALELPFLVYAGEKGQKVSQVAILNGAGGGAIPDILENYPVDCILTGDVGHHSARDALDEGVAVLDAGHYGTEKLMMENLLDRVKNLLAGKRIKLYTAENETSPFRVY